MAEEKNPEEVSLEETREEKDMTVDEEFQELFQDTEKLKTKWGGLVAANKDSNPEIAAIYRNIIGEILPLMSDYLRTTASGFGDVFDELAEVSEANDPVGLSEEEAKQIVIAQLMNIHAFEQLIAGSPEEAHDQLKQYLGVNQEALNIMQETYGEELIEEAKVTLSETAAEAETESKQEG